MTINDAHGELPLIYLIGSLGNKQVPVVARQLRELGYRVFDDWYAAGPHADEHWRDYERARGHDMVTALSGPAAQHNLTFDRSWLDRADAGVLLLPAGKSGHLELAYLAWSRRVPTYIVFEHGFEAERWDLMYGLLPTTFIPTVNDLLAEMKRRADASYHTIGAD